MRDARMCVRMCVLQYSISDYSQDLLERTIGLFHFCFSLPLSCFLTLILSYLFFQFFFFFFACSFRDRILLCGPGWPGLHGYHPVVASAVLGYGRSTAMPSEVGESYACVYAVLF